MKRKTVRNILILAMSLLLLWGCGREDTPAESLPEGETAASAASTPAEEIVPTAAADTGVELLVAEPHWDVDIYPDSVKQYVDLFIYSKEPLSEADIQVELPVDAPCSIRFGEGYLGSPPCDWEQPGTNILFSYELYMTYRGADWAALAEEYPSVREAKGKLAELIQQGKLFDPEYTENQAIVSRYEEKYDRFLEDYHSLTAAQLPRFYVYRLWLEFDLSKLTEDTAFSSLTLTVQGETRELEVGQVRLHKEFINVYADNAGLSKETYTVYPTLSEVRYHSGRMKVFAFHFTAEEDLTMTGCGYLTEGTELRRIHVRQTSPDNGTMDFYWDGSMLLDIDAGTTVDIHFDIYDPRLLQEGFEFRNWVYMTYEIRGKEYRYGLEHSYYYQPNYYEVYAVYFDGLDLSDYYQKYYYPFISAQAKEEDV